MANYVLCKHCGRAIMYDSIYCSYCGNPLKNTDTQSPVASSCPKCKRATAYDSVYCPYCGINIKNQKRLVQQDEKNIPRTVADYFCSGKIRKSELETLTNRYKIWKYTLTGKRKSDAVVLDGRLSGINTEYVTGYHDSYEYYFCGNYPDYCGVCIRHHRKLCDEYGYQRYYKSSD